MNYYLNPWKKYATFKGRATRAEYWIFTLVNNVIMGVLLIMAIKQDSMIAGILTGDSYYMRSAGSHGLSSSAVLELSLFCIFVLVVWLPSLAVSVRRMHDIGRSGWFVLVVLIPYVGGIIFLVMSLMKSQPEDNMYGQNPRQPAVLVG